jgi:hypothetical protein
VGRGGVGNERSEGEGIMDKQEERESRERQGCEGEAQMFLATLVFFRKHVASFFCVHCGMGPGMMWRPRPADAVNARDQSGRCVSFPVS